jgi:hypothetical protein
VSDLPPYPPPPDQPPAPYFPPPPAYPAAPDYGAPAQIYGPPSGQHRNSGRLGALVAAVVLVVVLFIGIVGYVVGGYAFASSRLSDASSAITTATAHRGYVNTAFDLLGQQIGSLSSVSDPSMAKSTADQIVAESRSMATTAGADDLALNAARSRLSDQRWLTSINSGRLTAEAARIDHARNAVGSVKSAAGDYVLLGQFLQAFFQAATDFNAVFSTSANGDLVGEAGADSALQADVLKAQRASTNAPGLPGEYHDLLISMQAFGVDAQTLINARTKVEFDAANTKVKADLKTLNAIDLSGTTAKIASYYKKFRDEFN